MKKKIIFSTFNNQWMTKKFNRHDSIAHFGFNLIKADVDMALKWTLLFDGKKQRENERTERLIKEKNNFYYSEKTTVQKNEK
jgi:hypothetical protein